MCLTNCSECKFYDSSPHHGGDIICGVQPAYATVYQRLKDLDDVTLGSIPLDIGTCSDFELRDDLKPIEVNLTLTTLQALRLLKNCRDRAIIAQFEEYISNLSNSLTMPQIAPNRSMGLLLQNRTSWIDVNSSCLSAVCYNARNRVLKIRFCSGDVYQYEDVPENIFDNLLDSASLGQYFNYYIKDVFDFSYLNE